ncbi:putative Peptidylamidoglycolate lyase [Verrucomicrobia bacterium]|nr:putative Peptidylamidoglycolate lyase [Verrucomicrobiota bacterium]
MKHRIYTVSALAILVGMLPVTLTRAQTPEIISQPQSLGALPEVNAAFAVTVSAASPGPLSYQWLFNGTNLSGGTARALSLIKVQPTNAGAYQVIVSNPFGSSTSAVASLMVNAQAAAPAFAFTVGQLGSGPGQLNYPLGLAVDNIGNLYVCDTRNSRMQKFSSSGAYLAQWGSSGSGPGQFNWPDGVALDSGGNIFVADYQNNRVQKFSPSGAYLTNWNRFKQFGALYGFQLPASVAVDTSNEVYVADYPGIQRYADDGTWRTNVVNGQQNAVALDNAGNLYAMDMSSVLVKKYTVAGALLGQWGASGTNAGQLRWAQGLAVDTNGNVYVADTDNNRVQKFDSNGNFLAQWGSYGTNRGQFYFPCRVAVDPAGKYVFVADTSNNRIQVFSYVPASLAAAPPSNTGPFAVQVTGFPGYTYTIQASTNFRDWIPVQTNPAPFTFFDTNWANQPSRFYRAVASP